MTDTLTSCTPSPFEQFRRTKDAGNKDWSSHDFARILVYRNFQGLN